AELAEAGPLPNLVERLGELVRRRPAGERVAPALAGQVGQLPVPLADLLLDVPPGLFVLPGPLVASVHGPAVLGGAFGDPGEVLAATGVQQVVGVLLTGPAQVAEQVLQQAGPQVALDVLPGVELDLRDGAVVGRVVRLGADQLVDPALQAAQE